MHTYITGKESHTIQPYGGIAEFSIGSGGGSGTCDWDYLHSMAFPSLMVALKLFMGKERRKNADGAQVHDNYDYDLQAGLSTQAFAMSSSGEHLFNDNSKYFSNYCLSIYGLY